MIKKLRRKFIIVTMISVSLVLTVIMSAVNVVNRAKISSYADNVLNVLYENGGTFSLPEPSAPPGNNDVPDTGETLRSADDNRPEEPENRKDPPKKPDGMNEETPYETRYFTVRFTDTETKTDVNNIAAVGEEKAVSLAEEAIGKHKTNGYIGIYRYLVADDGSFVLFVDCARQIDTAENFLYASLGISAAGLLAVFVFSLFFSSLAVKPIAESYEKQKRFVTDASHELKTPLTIISANNELSELSYGETQESRNIDKQVKRMTAMVKNLTALSRLDEKEKLTEKTDVSITDTLKDMVEMFRPSLEKDNRTFHADIGENCTTRGDEALLRQAFSTIFENAAKYALTKTELSVSLSKNDVTIVLKNDAADLPQGNLDRCFERFFRSEGARASAVPGDGIELSVVKAIVSLHGGTVHARGEAGGVFAVSVTLRRSKKI